ncbi:MAG: DUF3768 domain-containing protein [Gammaproteobacteria bacterium]|nr:DUF3768 domain-containing protein [Gammaproteobacteria bacterium]
MSDDFTHVFIERIAKLNDQLRTTFKGGRILLSDTVMNLPPELKKMVFLGVTEYREFRQPGYDTHDFGRFTLRGQSYYWAIQCYHPTLFEPSTDPSDPTKTRRVLLISSVVSSYADAGVVSVAS